MTRPGASPAPPGWQLGAGDGPGPARAGAVRRVQGTRSRPPGRDHGHHLARSGPVTAPPCPQAAWQGGVRWHTAVDIAGTRAPAWPLPLALPRDTVTRHG